MTSPSLTSCILSTSSFQNVTRIEPVSSTKTALRTRPFLPFSVVNAFSSKIVPTFPSMSTSHMPVVRSAICFSPCGSAPPPGCSGSTASIFSSSPRSIVAARPTCTSMLEPSRFNLVLAPLIRIISPSSALSISEALSSQKTSLVVPVSSAPTMLRTLPSEPSLCLVNVERRNTRWTCALSPILNIPSSRSEILCSPNADSLKSIPRSSISKSSSTLICPILPRFSSRASPSPFFT